MIKIKNQIKNKIDIIKLISDSLVSLPDRQRIVLEGRFGLKDGQELTLAKIGKAYSITRERVRQIESAALNNLRANVEKLGINKFLKLAKNYLDDIGGLRREDLLFNDMRNLADSGGSKNIFENQIRFLLSISDQFKCSRDARELCAFWYLNDETCKKALNFVNKLANFLRDKKGDLLEQGAFPQLFGQVAASSQLKDFIALNYVSVSKKFTTNYCGDFGLSSWSEVNPITARDWAYLVLKKENRPLHFVELAKVISQIRKGRPTYAQTVHNELIKDNRFVLVGRGTYGLKEQGFIPGTAKEMLIHFLKGKGPLKSRELINLVLQQRLFQENTLFLNLQDRKSFKRLPDGRYDITEA